MTPDAGTSTRCSPPHARRFQTRAGRPSWSSFSSLVARLYAPQRASTSNAPAVALEREGQPERGRDELVDRRRPVLRGALLAGVGRHPAGGEAVLGQLVGRRVVVLVVVVPAAGCRARARAAARAGRAGSASTGASESSSASPPIGPTRSSRMSCSTSSRSSRGVRASRSDIECHRARGRAPLGLRLVVQPAADLVGVALVVELGAAGPGPPGRAIGSNVRRVPKRVSWKSWSSSRSSQP